jgi:hypothetical protein
MDDWRLPLKILVVNEFRANEQTTKFMAADRCHRVNCSLYAQLIIMKVYVLRVLYVQSARTDLYKV